jgi:para-nitrobenzyl esterase
VFRDAAGVADGGLAALRALPLKTIFEAQKAAMMAGRAFGGVEPPFQLATDGTVLATEPVAAAIAGSADGVDLLIGFTRDDTTPFFCADDATWALDEATIASRLADGKGEAAAARLRAYIERTESIQPAAALAQLTSDEIMIAPAVRLAEQRRQRGVGSHLFRFSWAPESDRGRLGACHTIELPFVFGDFTAWTQAPMLGDARPEDLAGLTAAVQDAWIGFARDGSPGHPGLGEWGPFDPDSASTMDLDLTSALIEDPSDGRRDLWI